MSAIPSRSTRTSGTPVRVVSQYGGTPARRVTSERAATVRTKARVTGWITRSIMLATTVFAVLDLFLLATGGHR